MSDRTLRTRVVFLALTIGCLAFATRGSAVIFNVDSLADDIDEDTIEVACRTEKNECTLRAAVMQANVMPTDSTIVLPAGTYFLTRLPTGPDKADNGDLNLETPVNGDPVITIAGAGAALTIIDANQYDRVVRVHEHRTAYVSGVTLRNGFVVPFLGGGILNEGRLFLSASVVKLNRAYQGGGIYNLFAGFLDVDRCAIAENEAPSGYGGGIYNNGQMTLERSEIRDNDAGFGGGISSAYLSHVDQCTISGNKASQVGGGVYNNEGNLYLTNSTISGNESADDGGGVFNGQGEFWTHNATIAFNEADSDAEFGGSGGGVYNSGSFYPRSSVIMGNTHSDSPDLDDCFGTLKLFGQNAFSILNGACTFELQNADAAYFVRSVNGLGPLQFNGGSTRTHALAAGSGLIDGGASTADCVGSNDLPLTTDQRGGAKGVGTLCDLGAFEFGALPAGLIFADGFELGNLWAWG